MSWVELVIAQSSQLGGPATAQTHQRHLVEDIEFILMVFVEHYVEKLAVFF